MNNNMTLEDKLWVIIPKTIEIISEKLKIDLKTARDKFYNSKIYEMLDNPETKMWYYSPMFLASFFIDEINGKEIKDFYM